MPSILHMDSVLLESAAFEPRFPRSDKGINIEPSGYQFPKRNFYHPAQLCKQAVSFSFND